MIKRKIKRKNPDMEEWVEEILPKFGQNIKFKFLAEGSYAETYYFVIKDSNKLKSGEYILKIFTEKEISIKQINYLEKLSKYGLIPKIYYATKNYIIMKYIKSKNLKELTSIKSSCLISESLSKEDLNLILEKLAKLLNKWHELGFVHGDIHSGNILITDSKKVYLIDPDLERIHINNFSRDIRFFKDIYSLVNCGLSQFIIDEEVSRLLS